MKIRKKGLLAITAATLVLGAWAFLGVYQDREFSDYYLFTKHKPSLKFYFYAPVGESEKKVEDLPELERKEELAFVEYIHEGRGYERKIYLFSL
ncbi:hypothetical protein [Pelagicoccus mobilis]|uniref:Uncharacterized protein n=1 Tax=Pelagicoccus mobilis TaxID=415221 RepID=A0A934S1Q4_9BACT|nr:hypothetical protein [Pelagicoccus mobilis]MBK1880727.1 hypothetical protein [Pelagicoccus mobilis]